MFHQYMTLVIKGSPTEAQAAASARGIRLSRAQRNPRFPAETLAHAPAKFYLRAAAWFIEPGSAPFPTGSLLYYRTPEGNSK